MLLFQRVLMRFGLRFLPDLAWSSDVEVGNFIIGRHGRPGKLNPTVDNRAVIPFPWAEFKQGRDNHHQFKLWWC